MNRNILFIHVKEGVYMPNIKPISEMKNYTSIVNELSYGNRIYFTKNGTESCVTVEDEWLTANKLNIGDAWPTD